MLKVTDTGSGMDTKIMEKVFDPYFTTIQVGEGHEALAEFEQNPKAYDLIITDMTMPGMTGDKLTGAIMDINPEIPVLLRTGFSESMSEEKASAIGIKKIMNKPFLMKDLLRAVREILADVQQYL